VSPACATEVCAGRRREPREGGTRCTARGSRHGARGARRVLQVFTGVYKFLQVFTRFL